MVSLIEILFLILHFQQHFDSSFLRFTFDASNPIGYAIAAIVQYFMIRYIALILVVKQSILVGLFFVANSLTKDISNDLKLLNDSAQIDGKQTEATNQLSVFIELHSAGKQLS